MTPVTTWELAVADLMYAEQSADELREQLETLERRTSTIRRFLSIHDARLGWAERAGVAAEPRFGTAEPTQRAAMRHYEVAHIAVA
jgi:hypothetical protein